MENHFINIIHRLGFLMLFGKAKGIKNFLDSLGQENVIRNLLTALIKERKLIELVESNYNVYEENCLQVTNKIIKCN